MPLKFYGEEALKSESTAADEPVSILSISNERAARTSCLSPANSLSLLASLQ
jgi:hypothetical protein